MCFHKWNDVEERKISNCVTYLEQKCKKCNKIIRIGSKDSHCYGPVTETVYQTGGSAYCENATRPMFYKVCKICSHLDYEKT